MTFVRRRVRSRGDDVCVTRGGTGLRLDPSAHAAEPVCDRGPQVALRARDRAIVRTTSGRRGLRTPFGATGGGSGGEAGAGGGSSWRRGRSGTLAPLTPARWSSNAARHRTLRSTRSSRAVVAPARDVRHRSCTWGTSKAAPHTRLSTRRDSMSGASEASARRMTADGAHFAAPVGGRSGRGFCREEGELSPRRDEILDDLSMQGVSPTLLRRHGQSCLNKGGREQW